MDETVLVWKNFVIQLFLSQSCLEITIANSQFDDPFDI